MGHPVSCYQGPAHERSRWRFLPDNGIRHEAQIVIDPPIEDGQIVSGTDEHEGKPGCIPLYSGHPVISRPQWWGNGKMEK